MKQHVITYFELERKLEPFHQLSVYLSAPCYYLFKKFSYRSSSC